MNGHRIWESSEYSSIPKEKTVELPLNTTFLEWKVKCGALVLKGETPRVHQRIDVQVSISQISFDVLAPATTLQARNAAAFSAGAQADRDWLPIYGTKMLIGPEPWQRLLELACSLELWAVYWGQRA